MENKEDSVAKDYTERFNVGYTYSKAYPDLSLKILEQNKSSIQNQPLLAGMKEFIDSNNRERESRLNDLNNLRNPQGRENDFNIDR